MPTALQQILNANNAICENIERHQDDRAFLSSNVLARLRDLVEGVAVRLRAGRDDAQFGYEAIKAGVDYIASAPKKIQFLYRFHSLLQESVSHYAPDADTSERLMIKYYEYLIRLRELLRESCGIEVLSNLEDFPVDRDDSLREYHQKIAARIAALRKNPTPGGRRDRYYVLKTRPFFTGGRIFYEVTFRDPKDFPSKVDRIIAFTDIDMTDMFAANLVVVSDEIHVLGKVMPIMLIAEWEVSIRPCEFDNFARIFGVHMKMDTRQQEYRTLMRYLTSTASSLVDLITLSDARYQQIRDAVTERVTKPVIFPVLDQARALALRKGPGYNVIRYLLLQLRNRWLKEQYNAEACTLLSSLHLKYGCKPFDDMPFCTALVGHNPRAHDLFESLDASDRAHELLAHRVRTNVERQGMLYTPASELETFGDLAALVSRHNGALYYKHKPARCLEQDKGQVFIHEYEVGAAKIIERLQERAASGIAGYTAAVARWLDETWEPVDDPLKASALQALFAESRVALIYGAAGTGKSKMIDHIANYFNDKQKLLLANTHPAVDNLKRKVRANNTEFRTIASITRGSGSARAYDVLVIDECSTVSNADLLKVLDKVSFELLVLVGDVYQIESIQFGNWFELMPGFLPRSAVFELMTPYRTDNEQLLKFWTAVRNNDGDITELMGHYGYSAVLDESLFAQRDDDEIILCLNYDGLYGINNINRFLQSGNPSPAVEWGVNTYKVGDPVLFDDTDRFRGVIYNNLKGTIVDIHTEPGTIQFDMELDRPVSAFDVYGTELEWVADSTVRFSVHQRASSDNDDESNSTTVPFQVAYAVSIHKAQGLEYPSVKIVITDANEDDISHAIFYTAVTRARESLKVYWTPETQHAVIERLGRPDHNKDVEILSSRTGLKRRRR